MIIRGKDSAKQTELRISFQRFPSPCWSILNASTNHIHVFVPRDKYSARRSKARLCESETPQRLPRGEGSVDEYFMFVKESIKGSSCTATMVAARIKLSPIGIVVIGLVVVAIIYYLSTDGGRGEFSHKYFEGEDTVSMKRLIVTAIHLAEKGGDVVRKIRLGEDLGVSLSSN